MNAQSHNQNLFRNANRLGLSLELVQIFNYTWGKAIDQSPIFTATDYADAHSVTITTARKQINNAVKRGFLTIDRRAGRNSEGAMNTYRVSNEGENLAVKLFIKKKNDDR